MAAAASYRDILGDGNFFLEMQFQGIDEQRIVNTGLLPIARDLNLPLVCTNDVHYLRQDDYKPHDILLCIGTGKSVNDAQRLRYHGDQFFLKTAEEMAEIFKDYPEALSNTMRIAERVQRRDSERAVTTCRSSTCPKASTSTATSSTSRVRALPSA